MSDTPAMAVHGRVVFEDMCACLGANGWVHEVHAITSVKGAQLFLNSHNKSLEASYYYLP